MGEDDDQISTAMANVLQTILLTVTELEKFRKERDAHEAERKRDPNKKLRPWIHIHDKICENWFHFFHYCFFFFFELGRRVGGHIMGNKIKTDIINSVM